MKIIGKKFLPLIMVSLGVGVLASCGQTPLKPYEISEKAMDSFVKQINANSYTVIGRGTNVLTTAVHDENMVTWFFNEGSPYTDHFCATVNEETYYGFIDNKQQILAELQFMDKKTAVEVSEKTLPNYWLSNAISGGNIWTLFHNNYPDNPLKFNATPGSAFYNTICQMCDLGDLVASTIDDVTLEFDKMKVKQADLNFTYIPGGTQTRANGSLSIIFGQEVRQSDLVLAWVGNPNREYPDPVGELGDWPDTFSFAFNSVYGANLPKAADPLPYDTFFSYATNFNSATWVYDGYVEVHDFHGDESSQRQYINTLLKNNYSATIGATSTILRSPALRSRNGYELYAVITITLDEEDGLTIKTEPFFTSKTFGTRELVNTHILDAAAKFHELPASNNIISVAGIDQEFQAYEDRMGFYDYNLFMNVFLTYEDADQMTTYLNTYFEALLEDGYVYNQKDGTYTKSDLDSKGVVKLYNNSNNVADLIFYNQKHVLPDEAITNVVAANYPDFETSIPKENIESIMDIKGYFKVVDNLDFNHYYSISCEFENYQQVSAAIQAYNSALESAGFKRKSDSDRVERYENGDLAFLADYDVHGQTGTYLNIWFVF